MVNSNPVFEVFVKGTTVVFTSAFASLADARAYLQDNVTSDFARSLLSARALTDLQCAWVHKLATDALARESGRLVREPVEGLDLLPVQNLLWNAKHAGKKFPQIELRSTDGLRVVLKLAGEQSKHPGSTNLTDGRPYGVGRWFGRIDPNGRVQQGRDWNLQVEALLRAFAADPARVAKQHGVATGSCCFCSLPLSTKESRSVGYGPICAEKFGLPWGDCTAAEFEAEKANEVWEGIEAKPSRPSPSPDDVYPRDPYTGRYRYAGD